MQSDLFPLLMDVREKVGLYAVLTPRLLEEELSKRSYGRSAAVGRILGEGRDLFLVTKTKPGPKEIYNLACLVSEALDIEHKYVLVVLNDLNDCIFYNRMSI